VCWVAGLSSLTWPPDNTHHNSRGGPPFNTAGSGGRVFEPQEQVRLAGGLCPPAAVVRSGQRCHHRSAAAAGSPANHAVSHAYNHKYIFYVQQKIRTFFDCLEAKRQYEHLTKLYTLKYLHCCSFFSSPGRMKVISSITTTSRTPDMDRT